MRKIKIIQRINVKAIVALACALSILLPLHGLLFIQAKSNGITVTGKLYEFDEKSNYEIETSETNKTTSSSLLAGKLFISGNGKRVSQKNGFDAYSYKDETFKITYEFNKKALIDNGDNEHIISDNGKIIDAIKLDEKIQNGAIIVQTSKDANSWYESTVMLNTFSENAKNNLNLYESTSIQLNNGCFYRIIIVYETTKKIEDKSILFVDTSKYEKKKYAEVYEFYAYDEFAMSKTAPKEEEKKYRLGKIVRTKNFEGYSGEEPITRDDPHYNMEIGSFYVSGHTAKPQEENDNVVFLKNHDDKLVLWFKLEQDIKKCKGDSNIYVNSDPEGNDDYFQSEITDFGKGALLVRKRNLDTNEWSETTIYRNYLESNASPDSDTKVLLFEEGDYEVALDYELKQDIKHLGVIKTSKRSHYRIFFKFSVKNGTTFFLVRDVNNNIVYDGERVQEGFSVDIAKSKNLTIDIDYTSLDGFRKQYPATEGKVLNDKGTYIITVTNISTNKSYSETIYVGDDNDFIVETEVPYIDENNNENDTTPVEEVSQNEEIKENESDNSDVTTINIYIIFIPVILVGLIAAVFINKNQKNKRNVITVSKEENIE